jgi:hypothetical protein
VGHRWRLYRDYSQALEAEGWNYLHSTKDGTAAYADFVAAVVVPAAVNVAGIIAVAVSSAQLWRTGVTEMRCNGRHGTVQAFFERFPSQDSLPR